MGRLQKPGEKPDRPGEYKERKRDGTAVPDPRQVTIEPGDGKLPPTKKKTHRWERIGPPEE